MTAYNLCDVIALRGAVDVATLRRSLEALVRIHPVLRAGFVAEDGVPWQQIDDTVYLDFAIEALDAGHDDTSAALEALVDAERALPFTLEEGTLLSARLVRSGPERWHLALVTHHLLVDDWSMRLIWRDLSASYAALSGGGELPATQEVSRYAEVLTAHRTAASAAAEDDLSMWAGLLDSCVDRTRVPLDMPMPDAPSFAGDSVDLQVSSRHSRSLSILAADEHCTMFAVLAAAWAVVLRRWTQTTCVVLGTPVANRLEPGEQDTVGFFANTLALPLDVSREPTLRHLVRQVWARILLALEHQQTPFSAIVASLSSGAGTVTPIPLITASLVLEDIAVPDLLGIKASLQDIATHAAPTPLAMRVRSEDTGLRCRLEYMPEVLHRHTAERLAGAFAALLASAASTFDAPIDSLALG